MTASASWDDVMDSLGLEPSAPRRPRRGPGSVAACGTPAGSDRHYRLGEKPCDPCRRAKNAANNGWRTARRRAAGIKPRASVTCGTPAGARRHRARGEEVCEPCQVAFVARRAAYRARAKQVTA